MADKLVHREDSSSSREKTGDIRRGMDCAASVSGRQQARNRARDRGMAAIAERGPCTGIRRRLRRLQARRCG